MACNRDSNCYTIYSKEYPEAKAAIDNSLNTIDAELTSIEEKLMELEIPEDYLGEKVKREIEEILSQFTEDQESLKDTKTKIDSFISTQIGVHKSHYEHWKKRMDELAKNKDEDDIKE